jgi:hypothetical protein
MTKEEILAKVREILVQQLDVAPENVTRVAPPGRFPHGGRGRPSFSRGLHPALASLG